MIEYLKTLGRTLLRFTLRAGPYAVALLLPGGALIAALVFRQRRRAA